jgi:prevent-host-death family protein
VPVSGDTPDCAPHAAGPERAIQVDHRCGIAPPAGVPRTATAPALLARTPDGRTMWLRCRIASWPHEEVGVDSVGIRELRDGLSRYLAEVRAGRTVTVPDHGRPVARIVPVDEPSPLERLIAEGLVQPARRRRRSAPRPVEASGPVSDLVAEQRR